MSLRTKHPPGATTMCLNPHHAVAKCLDPCHATTAWVGMPSSTLIHTALARYLRSGGNVIATGVGMPPPQLWNTASREYSGEQEGMGAATETTMAMVERMEKI
uniref:Uncharacterized protein n=1 Tax=Oryza rufipogon TaxID=4529 RepID=A0A0E0P7X5_ORYRU